MRKLEYLAADALAQGCDTLVSIGGVQSNHTRAGRRRRRATWASACVLVQEHWVDWDDPGYDERRATSCSRGSWAATCARSGRLRHRHPRRAGRRRSRRSRRAGGKPYPIPAGASDHPLGGLGFADWVREVAEQERELGVFFDTVIVCSVTGSTQAGMIAGFARAGGETAA